VWSVPAVISALHIYQWGWLTRRISLGRAMLSEVPPWCLVALLTPALLALSRRYPLRRPLRAKSVLVQGAALVGVTLVTVAVFTWSYLLRRVVWWDLAMYEQYFPHVLTGFLPTLLLCFLVLNRETLVRLAAEEMTRKERQRAALALELANAQVRVIESQLHPHFLFNTLDSAVALVREGDPRRASRCLILLSDMLRSLLAFREVDEVPLQHEIDFVQSYLEMMKLRFEDRLVVTWAVEPGLSGARVPPMVLQPLVENAFKHGLERRARSGKLSLCARTCGGRLELLVEDDGPGPAPGFDLEQSRGLGIAGTRARLAELYGGEAAVALEARTEGGARASVSMPLIRPDPISGEGARPVLREAS
jgi:hypothetical protein